MNADAQPTTLAAGRWHRSVAAIRADPGLHENILRSVMTSMEMSGFEVSREQSERIFEEALSGPPLLYPGRAALQAAGAAGEDGEA